MQAQMEYIEKKLTVMFKESFGKLAGDIIADWQRKSIIHSYISREKIVFIHGLKNGAIRPGANLPQPNEEWICEEIRDTKPEESFRGCIFVKPLKNITAEKKLIEEEEKKKYASIMKTVDCDLYTAKKIAEFAEEVISTCIMIDVKKGLNIKDGDYKAAMKFVLAIKSELLLNLIFPSNGFYRDHSPAFKVNSIIQATIAWVKNMGKGGSFKKDSNRYFKCLVCEGQTRLTKSAMREFNENSNYQITCDHCGRTGKIK